MIEVALLMMIPMSLFLLVIVVLGIVLIVKNKEPSSPVVDPEPDPITITDGAMYTVSKGGSYIKQDFDESRGKGKMCDAVSTSTSSEAAPFKFTKDGDFWTVGTDCDGDGNYTSFLNGSSDLIAARDKDTPKRQQWTVSCESGGCSFKNRHKDKYLSGTPEKPEFVSNAVLFELNASW